MRRYPSFEVIRNLGRSSRNDGAGTSQQASSSPSPKISRRGAAAKEAKRIRTFRKRRQRCFNCGLFVPTVTALFQIVFGFWLAVILVRMNLHCHFKPEYVEPPNGTVRLIPVYPFKDDGTDPTGQCANMSSHYPSPTLELLSPYMMIGGGVRLAMTVFLRHEGRRHSEMKNVWPCLILTGLISIGTSVWSGSAYNPWRHEDEPHVYESDLYGLCNFLRFVFWFSLPEGIATLISLFFLDICNRCCYVEKLPDPGIEMDDFEESEVNRRQKMLEAAYDL